MWTCKKKKIIIHLGSSLVTGLNIFKKFIDGLWSMECIFFGNFDKVHLVLIQIRTCLLDLKSPITKNNDQELIGIAYPSSKMAGCDNNMTYNIVLMSYIKILQISYKLT